MNIEAAERRISELEREQENLRQQILAIWYRRIQLLQAMALRNREQIVIL